MKQQVYIIDDFYNNPDDVRENALNADYSVEGNYPGMRSGPQESIHSLYLKKFLEDNVLHTHISHWSLDDYNTAFQYTTKADHTWVHHDSTTWAGVLYLSKDPVPESGTTIYSRIDNGVYEHVDDATDYNTDSDLIANLSNWRQEISVENRYNRLILYKGALYHRSTNPGWGYGPHDGRLFQVFFFDTIS